jgi:hypothetical protein
MADRGKEVTYINQIHVGAPNKSVEVPEEKLPKVLERNERQTQNPDYRLFELGKATHI